MSSNTAVSVRGLAKAYTILHNHERQNTLAEAALARLRHPLRRAQRETFWALSDVSFDVQKGDVVGIIGRNGAGKSTLLKLLSRITQPTKGEIHIRGRVGSLLEVGTGFHPELTGRENIYLNGQILGMRKKEIDRQFDAIVDFSGVQQFLDTPVKRYSSGMYVRLAFAVAAHLQSEILVVDEVLAVGDAEFQRKCLGKMKDVATDGRTILFVSHQMQAVNSLCKSAVYLESGAVKFIGAPRQAIDHYLNASPFQRNNERTRRRPGTGELRFADVTLNKANYHTTEDIVIDMPVEILRRTQPQYFVSVEIINAHGLPVLHLDSRLHNHLFAPDVERSIRYHIAEPRLAQGDYRVNAYICSAAGIIDRFEDAARFSIMPVLPYPASRGDIVSNALIYPDFAIQVRDLDRAADEYVSPRDQVPA
ncbi:MAG TPA: polysaccharide ABC transporter ATP-binding protein [Phycisphaerae bacterium]|nr:polysaccharide ABC transporter ATP-binding protein [Phycisphaerae bacterium]